MTADPDASLQRILKALSRSPHDKPTWRELYKLMWPSVVSEAFYVLGRNVTKAQDAANRLFKSLESAPQLDLLEDPHAFRSDVSSRVLHMSREVREQWDEDEREEVRQMLRELDETPDNAQKLSPKEHDVLRRRFDDGQTYERIANDCKMSPDEVRELVAEARLHLRMLTGRVPDNLPIPGDL